MFHITKNTIEKIKRVKDFTKKTDIEIAREAKLTLEVVAIALSRAGYKPVYK